MEVIRNASVVVTSDTCYKDPANDTSGQYVVDQLKILNFNRVTKHIVEDDKEAITDCVKSTLNDENNVLTITVGGTGLCPRDVTPEATSILYDKHCTGISTALLVTSLRYSPHAALSRLSAGIAGNCLIVNFPGKPKACRECFACLELILEHALEQVEFNDKSIRATHKLQDTPPTISKSKTILDEQKEEKETVSIEEILKQSKSVYVTREKLDSDHPVEYLKKLSLNSPYPLIDYEEARKILDSESKFLCTTEIELDLSKTSSIIGHITAEDLPSKLKIPPYRVSTMDGYVLNIPDNLIKFEKNLGKVRSSLVANLEEFEKMQRDENCSKKFFCYQVNTGGKVPNDHYAVIPIEKTGPNTEDFISINEIKLGLYVREPGIDLNSKDYIPKGTKLGPIELSLLISMGYKSVKVVREPIIGILSTGDELVEFSKYDENDPAKVIDTNGPLLISLLENKHYTVLNFGIAKDNPEEISSRIQTCFMLCDLMIITGGASMGSKDHVKDVIEQLSGTIHFGRVNIKPGKPAAFASIDFSGKRKFIFSLPGNPVSAYITAIALILPFINYGIRNHLNMKLPMTLNDIGELLTVEIGSISDGEEYIFDGRLEFVRAKLISEKKEGSNATSLVSVSTRQQSSCLLSLLNCYCLIIISPCLKGQRFLEGQIYSALKLKSLNSNSCHFELIN